MTSHEARGGRDSTSGHGLRERPRSSPTSVLSMLGTMSWGSEALGPGAFPQLISLGLVARNATRRGRLEGRRDRGRGSPNPGSRPKPCNLRSLGKRPHRLEPLPPPSYGPSCGPIGLARPSGRNLCLCFLLVNSVDGYEGPIPACRQEIGYFSLHRIPFLSVHLIDRCPTTGPSLRRREGRTPFPLQRPVVSRMGERCQVLWIGPGSKRPGLIRAFQARSTTQRHNDQVIRVFPTRRAATGPGSANR